MIAASSIARRGRVLALVAILLPGLDLGGDGAFDVQGHRGCRGLWPENSMAAFRHALALGVTTLELDLQSTADGVLVVHHDQALERKRCVDGAGQPAGWRLIDVSMEALSEVDCGRARSHGFPDQQLTEAPVPRLEEVLELAAADGTVRLNIEIKLQKARNGAPVDEVARTLVALIREHGLLERTTVQSFRPEALVAVAEFDASLERSLLTRSAVSEEALKAARATQVSPRFSGLTRKDVARYQEAGYPVLPWTVNQPDHIRRAIDWGVDGLISDYPDRVLDALAASDP